MTADPAFALNPRVNAALDHVGTEREPLLIVDDVIEQPEELITYAAEEVCFEPVWGPQGGYPGIRAPAPLNYVERLVRGLGPLIERAFDLRRAKLARAECSFSLVTLPPDQLVPAQRAPHIDTTDPLQFALLHYLCGPEHGGTAFYRHRATGFETMSESRQADYTRARAAEQEPAGTSTGYIVKDDPFFEQTGAVEARLNRVAIYRSCLLHSGLITDSAKLSTDPRTGRLTANIFITYRRL